MTLKENLLLKWVLEFLEIAEMHFWVVRALQFVFNRYKNSKFFTSVGSLLDIYFHHFNRDIFLRKINQFYAFSFLNFFIFPTFLNNSIMAYISAPVKNIHWKKINFNRIS